MPSAASAQRQGQIVREQFKSYFAASKEFKAHPDKFQGKPRLPGYSKKFRSFVVGRNGYQIEKGMLTITGAKRFGFEPIKVTCCENQKFNSKVSDTVCGDLRICPKGKSFVIEITYRREVSAGAVLLNKDHALAIDLGIDNLAACVSTEPGVAPLLIKGGVLKSINQWWNKRAGELQSLGKYGHLADIAFSGMYKTKDGRLINADIQGAIGIARKELGDEWLRSFLANGGRVDRPVVIRNLHSKLDCAALLKKGRRALETLCVSVG